MTPQLRMDALVRVISAAESVDRMRLLILDLGVRGLLTSPSSALTSEADVLPPVPRAWRWLTVAEIAAPGPAAITDGPFGSHLKTEHYIPHSNCRVVRLQNIERLAFNLSHRTFIAESHFEALRKHEVFAGDLVVAGLVDPSLRCAEIPPELGPALVKADCYRLKVSRAMNRRFVLFYLNSPTCQSFAAGHHHGMTLTRIGLGNFKRIPVPVPPIEEQDRIVAKVDALLALYDELDVAQRKRDDTRDRLRVASLARLTDPTETPGKVAQRDATFFLSRSDRMVTKPEHVAELRRAILDLAVDGKLSSPEAPWPTVSLADVCVKVTDGDHQPPPKAHNGIPFLVIGNVRSGAIDFLGCRFVPLDYYDSLDEFHRPRNGDVLYTLVGSFGIPVAVEGNDKFCVQRHIAILRPGSQIDPRYLIIALGCRRSFDQADAMATGIAQKTVPLRGLRSLKLPLPAVAEQKLLVAKVQELLAVCDQLEQALRSAEEGLAKLLEAVLHRALNVGAELTEATA